MKQNMKTEMKELACRDMGIDCDFVAKGTSNEQVKMMLMDHAKDAHPEIMEDPSPENMKMMEEKMDMLMDKGMGMDA